MRANKQTLWTFGCSFTAEYHPLNNTPPNNYDLYRDWKGGTLPAVWPTLLASKLNYNLKNLGVGASSNYHIFRNFCNNVSDIQENDLVIIGWTSLLRFVLVNKDTLQLQDILPSNKYTEFDDTILEYIFVNRENDKWNDEILSFMKIINEVCRYKKINIFYWTSDDFMLEYWKSNNLYQDTKIIKTKINKTLIDLDYFDNNINCTIEKETDGIVVDYHMGEYGHKKQAKVIHNYIKEFI